MSRFSLLPLGIFLSLATAGLHAQNVEAQRAALRTAIANAEAGKADDAR